MGKIVTSKLGPVLKAARERAGLSMREASRRTPGVSDITWRKLERGTYREQGQTLPYRSTSLTVIRAARTVGLDVDEALNLAGLPPLLDREEPAPPNRYLDLSHLAEADALFVRNLAARLHASTAPVIEINRRQVRQHKGRSEPPSGANGTTG